MAKNQKSELQANLKSGLNLRIDKDKDLNSIILLGEAISNPLRIKILRELQKEPFIFSVPQLVKKLNIPTTTLIHHLEKLEKGKLIQMRYKGSTQGTTRIVCRNISCALVTFHCNYFKEDVELNVFTQETQVGLYSDFIGEILNIVTAKEELKAENPFIDDRVNAELIYTPNGIVTYNFSNNVAKTKEIEKINFSLELCSEAPYYDNDYLSEITFWVNKKEICTYLSEGDYGDRRGNVTPTWWSRKNTQYGKLVNILIDKTGVFINDKKVNDKINVDNLNLDKDNKVTFALGNKPTATYVGGFNLFGKCFGDHMQGIIMNVYYK